MTSLAERRIRLRSYTERREDDPLAFWRHASTQSREATKLVSQVDEVYARAANKAGKTEWAGALTLAMLQKRPDLDGVPLPQWRGPVSGLALSLDYNQQKLSVQQTLLRLLGKWPHHAKWKGDDILSSLRIKPMGGSDDEQEWSILTFMSQENKRAGVGARADVVWADEPPVEEIWREVRKAAHAGRHMVRLISATPIFRRQWAWLKADYGDCARESIRRQQDVAEVRWSLEDNKILSGEEIAKLKRLFGKEPAIYDARVFGDYIDASGSCPFHVPTILKMLEECLEPEIVDKPIQEEMNDEGVPTTVRRVPVEVFMQPKPGRSYWMTIDASSGVDDAKHDPFEIEISEIGSGDLVSRCGGYLSGRLVGILGAGLARQYNGAVADPEVNDRWGVNVVEGFHAAQYGHFAREPRELRPGEWSQEIGFHNTAKSRPLIIGSIQSWIESWRVGVRYAACPSRFILNTLLDCILDETGKIVAAPGLHDEALICWGQLLRRAVTRSGRDIPDVYRAPKSEAARLVSLVRGDDDDDDEPHANGHGRSGRGPKW